MAEPGPVDRPRSAPTAGPPGPASGDAAGVTRGFLFADLRDYTSYVDAHGDRAGAALLERYRSLVRAALTAAGGAEIRTEGDSFYVVFGSVSAAIRAGLAIVDAAARTTAEPEPIRVGVGVHAGETTETVEGFVGSAVNIAARLCAQAKAGELVVSDTVRNITRTQIEVEFQPLGQRRLKGVTEPITCYRVVSGGTASAGAARPRRAAGLPRTRLLAASLAAVVILAVGAGTLILGGSRAAPTASPAASPAAGAVDATPAASRSPAPTPSASQAAGALASPGPYPNVAEAAILAALPTTLAQPCIRGGTPDDARLAGFVGSFYYDGTYAAPYMTKGPSYVPVAPTLLQAGLTCRPATGAARLYVQEPGWPTGWIVGYKTQIALGDTYIGFLEVHWKIPVGSCGTDKLAYEAWTGPGGNGTLACMNPYDGRPWIYFTFGKGRYLGFATRDDSNYGDLYAWWEQLKTFLP